MNLGRIYEWMKQHKRVSYIAAIFALPGMPVLFYLTLASFTVRYTLVSNSLAADLFYLEGRFALLYTSAAIFWYSVCFLYRAAVDGWPNPRYPAHPPMIVWPYAGLLTSFTFFLWGAVVLGKAQSGGHGIGIGLAIIPLFAIAFPITVPSIIVGGRSIIEILK